MVIGGCVRWNEDENYESIRLSQVIHSQFITQSCPHRNNREIEQCRSRLKTWEPKLAIPIVPQAGRENRPSLSHCCNDMNICDISVLKSVGFFFCDKTWTPLCPLPNFLLLAVGSAAESKRFSGMRHSRIISWAELLCPLHSLLWSRGNICNWKILWWLLSLCERKNFMSSSFANTYAVCTCMRPLLI